MNRRKLAVCFMLVISMLLSACGAFTPLLTEDEVLSQLSERYGGTEFVILETIDGGDYVDGKVKAAHLYRIAPAEEQEQEFWVFSSVRQYTRDSLPSYYSHDLEDTYAFDFFLKQFNCFLIENNIHGFFRSQNNKVDISEFVSHFHFQGGHLLVYVTRESAENVVNQVFEFMDEFYTEYPYQKELDGLPLVIYFYDETNHIQDGEEAQGVNIIHEKVLYEQTYCYPFDGKTKYNDAKSVLKAINELYYGITSE